MSVVWIISCPWGNVNTIFKLKGKAFWLVIHDDDLKTLTFHMISFITSWSHQFQTTSQKEQVLDVTAFCDVAHVSKESVMKNLMLRVKMIQHSIGKSFDSSSEKYNFKTPKK